MSLKSAYDTFWRWMTTLSVVITCSIVYYSIYLAHFGTPLQIAQNTLARWFAREPLVWQVVAFAVAPVVGAVIGGVILGCIVVLILESIFKSIFGRIN